VPGVDGVSDPPDEGAPAEGDAVLLGKERLPPPATAPRASFREPEHYTDPTPRSSRVASSRAGASRPSLSGPDLRPIPRAPISTRRRDGSAPAAPRPGVGTAYPMPGDGEPPPPRGGGPAPVHLTPRMTAIFGGLIGLAALTSLIALLIQADPPRNERAIVAGTASGSAAPGESSAAPSRPEAAPKKRVRVAVPGPWRLAELEKTPGITVERGVMERKSLFEVLGDKNVPKAEVYRLIKALDGIKKFDKPHKKDRFAVAYDRAAKKVRAFEYEVTPSEIYQAREGENGLLTGSKLDMKLAEEELTGAFYVGSDLTASYQAGGFEDGIIAALDEALAGHMSSEGFEEGGTVRVIAVEETALGLFSRYKRIVALEYKPADPAGKPVRMYTFNGQEARGYWDDKGRQPSSGGWRSPVPGAPVTSPFNPKRLHPVLHTVMPHTGTDFGAGTGTPIYAVYRGEVISSGPLGPCGNAVQIQHAKGIVTGYCHMSRFAGLKAGEHVGTHQLIGYVGATGRVTGPHLHFFVKKNNVFVDSRTLHLDGDRPVPSVDRGAFLAAKAELDRRLDAIPMPDPPPEAPKAVAAAAGSGSAEPEAPPAGKEKDKDKDGKAPPVDRSGRHAVQVGSPEAIAAAKAEPGIHPSQFVEVKGEGDDEDDGPAGTPTPATAPPKGKGKPDPAEEEDDEK
jgi:murein DD-endopeptidase MepM/ murein hydrolase activator NlpD